MIQIGTTVKEPDPSFMLGCFIKAFAENSIKIDTSDFYQYRRLDKKTAIRTILKKYDYPGNLCENIFHSFENIIDLSLQNFSEMENAAQLFTFLKSRKIQIGIGSGLPANLFQRGHLCIIIYMVVQKVRRSKNMDRHYRCHI